MTQLRLTTGTLTALGGIGLYIGDMGLALLGAGFGALGMFLIIRGRMKGES
jgi:hypothetical protein